MSWKSSKMSASLYSRRLREERFLLLVTIPLYHQAGFLVRRRGVLAFDFTHHAGLEDANAGMHPGIEWFRLENVGRHQAVDLGGVGFFKWIAGGGDLPLAP